MRIVIIGSGNIAHFFASKLKDSQFIVSQVYSPNLDHAASLAERYQIEYFTNHISEIRDDADVYLLAVKDDVLAPMAELLRFSEKIIIHCAGSVSLDVLAVSSENRAVIWPVYSIKKEHLPEERIVPLIVEANTGKALEIAMKLAECISDNVVEVNFQQRKMMHLNAVMVNNFTNHLLTIAEKLSGEYQLSFDILKPIINQTLSQLQLVNPSESQTGPAIRHDEVTMQRHQDLLVNHPLWQQIYRDISLSIQQSAE